MKSTLINFCVSFISTLVFLLLLEGVAQIYVYKIAKKGKLFEPDELMGWSVIPHLELDRFNANGNIWTINTDANGFRKSDPWDTNKKKVLILGDSFAFGQGVNIDDRFDTMLSEQGYSVLNTGVMGYGTDQQYMRAKPYLSQLDKGDMVVVLTYYNDFHDISLRQHSGRKKPWFELEQGKLALHKPHITSKDILRDKSYLYAKLSSMLASYDELSDADLSYALDIYETIIVNELSTLENQGIHLTLAYHGMPLINNDRYLIQIEETLSRICNETEIECLNLDAQFNRADNSDHFLYDGHWNKKGHSVVGSLLTEKLSEIMQYASTNDSLVSATGTY